MNFDELLKLLTDSFMKLQVIFNRFLIVAWVWMSFYLAYKDTFTENPTFPEMLLYIIRFITRPVEFVIDKLFYT